MSRQTDISPGSGRGFASALHRNHDLEPLIASARHRKVAATTRAFCERFAPQLSPELGACVQQLPEHAVTRRAEVDRAMMALDVALADAAASPTEQALRAVVVLAGAGVRFDLSCALERPLRLRWRNWLLPHGSRVDLRSDAPFRIQLQTRNGVQHIEADPDAARPGVVPLPVAAHGGSTAQVIFPWALDSAAALPVQAPACPLPGPEVCAMLQAALELIARASPPYAAFCGAVLTDVFPIDGRDGMSRSASHASALGHIALSAPARPLVLAELFVHECSHQYFHLASALAPLHDGSDTHLYYSPVKRCPRPVERILLAHHAFANIVLFHRSVIAAGLDDDGRAAAAIARHLPSLHALETALDTTTALTELGRALYLPYRELTTYG